MLKKAIANLAAALTAALTLPVAVQLAAEPRVIHAGTLLDQPGEAPRSPGTLVLEDGLIKSVHDGIVSVSALSLPPDTEVLDLSEHFVMPGFIDLHVHLSSNATAGARNLYVRKPDAYFALVGADNARKTLMAGFTTVRDLGSRGHAIFALRDAIEDGLVPGPRLLVAGSAITPSGGHADFHGYREEVAEALPAAGTCNGADDCMRAVRETIKRGADVIKVTSTGGVLSDTAAGTGQQFTHDELKAIVTAAHMMGRKVTAHAHAKAGIEAALNAGFDSIEHSMWADEGTMRLFKKTGAWMIPTVYPITYVGDTPEKMKQGPFKDAPPAVMEKLLALGRQPKDMTRLAYDSGVKIALGTDSGVSPHGENANEFVEYVGIGMTPMEALVAGTRDAAVAAGISDAGRLEAGMRADLVAMALSPLEDIRAVLDVPVVIKTGEVVKWEIREP
jgi:imidazolonepropionase-like amidohydrolase